MKLSFMVFKNARYLEVLWNLIKCNQKKAYFTVSWWFLIHVNVW